MKLRPRRVAAWGLALAIVVVLVWALRPNPVQADFAAVTRGLLRVTIDEEGETRIRERFVISAPLAGTVLRIELEPGDPVKAGTTILARFRPADPTLLDVRSRAEIEGLIKAAEAALRQARAQRERGDAELNFARSQLARYRQLHEHGIISQDQLETAELDERVKRDALEAAESAMRRAEYELQVARARLVRTEKDAAGSVGASGPRQVVNIRSPVDGVILRRLRQSQAVVAAGEPLLEVGDPADLEIVSDLLSADAVKIRPGNKVLVEQWGGGNTLHGRVRRVEPSGFTKISALGVEEQRVNVIIDFEDPRAAWEALGDAYRVEVRVVIWEREDVLKVPTSSLFRSGEGWAVFVVREGKARRQPVEIGQRNALEAEALSGLAEGDQVIMHPSDAIADGVSVARRPF